MSIPSQPVADTEELERTLRELLAPERLPDYIQSARYELSTDQWGEPLVRIYLAITPETDETLFRNKQKLEAYSVYKQDLAKRIIRLESGYLPFIRLVEAA
jgi:hypothetical protein